MRRGLRVVALRRVLGLGAAIACLLAAAGCSRGAGPSGASAPQAVHVVIQTEGETFEGVPEGERLVVRGTMRIWADPAASMRPTSYESSRAGEPAYRREELVRGGVWSIYDAAAGESPAEAFQFGAALAEKGPPGPGDDPMRRGVLDAYRRWIASGEATITGSGDASGTPTFRVEASSGTSLGGVVLRADVRRSDYVPVRMTGERWNLIRGKRQIAETWSARYIVVETLSRSSVPSGTFELEFPSGVVPRADFSVTASQVDKRIPVSTVTVGGQPALRAAYSQTYGSNGTVRSWPVTWVVLDLGDATVVIEGIGATPAELDSAVRSLRRVGE